MAATCPVGLDVDALRKRVRGEYERLAHEPQGDFHFHRGLEYACGLLGYDRRELQSLPEECVERFSGVGNPHRIGPIQPGEVILDVGCGAGMDLLLAARRVNPHGKAIGLDMTLAMCERARAAAVQAGLWQSLDIRVGRAEELPVEDESIDVVISNGVINLSPDKYRAFGEILRVLRPGGRLYLADVVIRRELSLNDRSKIDLWAAGIAGALPEAELVKLTGKIGFLDAQIMERFDCYKGTSAVERLSQGLLPQGVNFSARKAG